jgi:hypothetical protein
MVMNSFEWNPNIENGDVFKELTMMSKLVKLLIKILFILIKKGSGLTFKLCSFVTLSFIAIYWGVPLGVAGVSNCLAFQVLDLFLEYIKKENIVDITSMLVLGQFFYLLLLCPLFLGHAFPSVTSITLAKDLKWPRHGAKHVLSIFLFVIGLGISNVPMFKHIFWDRSVATTIWAPLYLLQITSQIILYLYWFVPMLLVSTWMEKFISLCQYEAVGKEISHAKSCVKTYAKIEKVFGTLFVFYFGMSQLLIIFSLFLAISQAVGSNRSGWERMVQSFSLLLITSNSSINIYGFACILDDVHQTFKGISNGLQGKMRQISDEMEKG